MIIGVTTIKPMKTYKEQFIATQFIILGIPLIPLQSYFFLDDVSGRGIKIGWYGPQILKTYCVFVGLIGLLIFGLDIWHPSMFRSISTTSAWMGFLAFGAMIGYFGFFFNKMDDQEKELRELYGHVVGINALPEYLSDEVANDMLKDFKRNFKKDFEATWDEVLKEKEVEPAQVPQLFAILGYSKRLGNNQALVNQYYDSIHKMYKTMLITAAMHE